MPLLCRERCPRRRMPQKIYALERVCARGEEGSCRSCQCACRNKSWRESIHRLNVKVKDAHKKRNRLCRVVLAVLFVAASLSEAILPEARRFKHGKATKATKLHKESKASTYSVSIGSRPYFILDSMEDSNLKTSLQNCTKTVSMDKNMIGVLGTVVLACR